jgi:hypothetical protein
VHPAVPALEQWHPLESSSGRRSAASAPRREVPYDEMCGGRGHVHNGRPLQPGDRVNLFGAGGVAPPRRQLGPYVQAPTAS